ncbi:MAG: hypothetical protein IJO74_04560 [Clostridia bacterium]|nr:hypothetical protein [Clostridia bacterium]
MSGHKIYGHLIHEYVLGNLDEKTATQLEIEIQQNDELKKLLDAEKLYCDNIKSVAEHLENCPGDLKNSVLSRIEAEKRQPVIHIPEKRPFRFPVATAASLVLVFALLFVSKNIKPETADDMAVQEFYTADSVLFYSKSSSSPAEKEMMLTSGTAPDAATQDEEQPVNYYMDMVTDDCEAVAEKNLSAENPGNMLFSVQPDALPENSLTYEFLIFLVEEKGESINRNDFSGFEGEIVGNNPLEYRYHITKNCYLVLWGGTSDTPPETIKLVSSADEGDFITFPYGDIKEFISRIDSDYNI